MRDIDLDRKDHNNHYKKSASHKLLWPITDIFIVIQARLYNCFSVVHEKSGEQLLSDTNRQTIFNLFYEVKNKRQYRNDEGDGDKQRQRHILHSRNKNKIQ